MESFGTSTQVPLQNQLNAINTISNSAEYIPSLKRGRGQMGKSGMNGILAREIT
jgi:hypothetical protein